MKAASMIVLYDVASPDVVGHIILDHVSLISHYSEMHHREVVHGTRLISRRATMFSQMPTEACMGVVKPGMQPLRRMHVHY